jgi:SAM-dependent methyltransferase
MISAQTNSVKQQVAAHWNRRAGHFDEDFGHSIRTPAERAAWDRVLELVLPAGGVLEALDIGCGTGFLSLELASRRQRVTGIDFAPAMIAEAGKKAVERQLPISFAEADAEQLPFAAGSFDMAVSRHLLWTLPHPDTAIDEPIPVVRVAVAWRVRSTRTGPSPSVRTSALRDQEATLRRRPTTESTSGLGHSRIRGADYHAYGCNDAPRDLWPRQRPPRIRAAATI